MLLGDILEDLPAINNFTVAERADYTGPPDNPLLAYLRRGTSAEERGKHQQKGAQADHAMKPTNAAYAAAARFQEKEGQALQVASMSHDAQHCPPTMLHWPAAVHQTIQNWLIWCSDP